ncbi:MAG TPA: sugar phosphate isomerase/epimerase family protein [Terriglobia bacterium]|jgi:L-ribulose-5-phosphate 3-epimerase|nr:sugar phosphate isomerase/epimerase family protein [Terriglobia bacterium]
MNPIDRREFLEISATGAWAAARLGDAIQTAPGQAPSAAQKQPARPMPLGLIVGVDENPEEALGKVHQLGVPTCQVLANTYGPEAAERLREALAHYHLEATSLVVTGPGPEDYDFYKGPLTIGLVPREYRATRIEHIKRASDFAQILGIPAVQTHCGFIPENPNDPVYKEAVDAIREVAGYCREHSQQFRYETGQETPVTLLRAIQDVGLDNQGLNFDCGNLILYGKANPVDALEVVGRYVHGVHAKDGLYPTNPHDLGEEVPIGSGRVDFPKLLARLKDLGYQGAITIEREISGPKQMEDLKKEKAYLEDLISRTWA